MCEDTKIAGVKIDTDRLDDERGTVWLYDKKGHRIAEIRGVYRITIDCGWEGFSD